MSESPILFDVTRLISRSWTRRLSTGIDRVCYAYLDHFRSRAQAVVQHKGVFRVLTQRHSDTLFDMLRGADGHFRRRMAAFAPAALTSGVSRIDGRGATYVNVSHTDFDLDSHVQWGESCGFRTVYLIHDLIPITHAEHCRPHAVRRHRGRVTNALRHASGIIVNSSATADELTSFSRREKLTAPPLLVAPLAGASLSSAGDVPAADEPYFVCVGTIEPRKNHLMLLDLWKAMVARLGKAAPLLAIIGQWGPNSDAVRARLRDCGGLDGRIQMVEGCDDAALGQWIAGARALLMPTLAEGFGLPMVEALRLGTPVIASDLPCFRETGEGIPLLLDPLDPAAWANAVLDFTGNHTERKRQLSRLSAYRPASWDTHFTEVERWLEVLPQRRSHTPGMVREQAGSLAPFAAASPISLAGRYRA